MSNLTDALIAAKLIGAQGGGSGGGSGGGETTTPLIVKIDWDDNLGPDGGYFADHTYNEVRDAIDNGQIVIGIAFGFYALTEDVRGAVPRTFRFQEV